MLFTVFCFYFANAVKLLIHLIHTGDRTEIWKVLFQHRLECSVWQRRLQWMRQRYLVSHMELHTTPKTSNPVCFSWKNNPKSGNRLFPQEKSCKALHRPHIRIMQRTGRNGRRNRVLFKWWDSEKRDSRNPWKIPGFSEKKWPWHLHPTLLVYGQHQRNFSPSWNFRKQS